VHIPSALIAPKDLTTSVSTSLDERVVGIDTEEDAPSTLERVRSQIDVVLGDDVRVDSYGLKAKLGGAVTVLTRPADVARGQGAINVLSGNTRPSGRTSGSRAGAFHTTTRRSHSRRSTSSPSGASRTRT
jgi:translocation and assembly module TamB